MLSVGDFGVNTGFGGGERPLLGFFLGGDIGSSSDSTSSPGNNVRSRRLWRKSAFLEQIECGPREYIQRGDKVGHTVKRFTHRRRELGLSEVLVWATGEGVLQTQKPC